MCHTFDRMLVTNVLIGEIPNRVLSNSLAPNSVWENTTIDSLVTREGSEA